MYFPVAGVELNPLVPVLVGVIASLIFGQVGLTGGIATLPFMMSVLNFTSPSVSSTNLLFVLISPFGSVYSYWKEKRMLWHLGVVAGLGGVLGSFFGPMIRVGPLGDITKFKVLFGVLLGLVGLRLLLKKHMEIGIGRIERSTGSLSRQDFIFSDNSYAYPPVFVFFGGVIAGTISTTFGLGTGFILVPFYTTVLRLPIYAVAGSALLSTLIISTAGAVVYSSLSTSISTVPDVRLGLLLGVGGVLGGFMSAKVQRRVSSNTLHKALGATLFLWAMTYLRHGF